MKENSIKDKRYVFKKIHYPEMRKTYFLAPKWEGEGGVDLYTGSTYTWDQIIHG